MLRRAVNAIRLPKPKLMCVCVYIYNLNLLTKPITAGAAASRERHPSRRHAGQFYFGRCTSRWYVCFFFKLCFGRWSVLGFST